VSDLNRDEPCRLRLLSYNIQVGISSTRPHHYLTKSWKHLLPARRRFEILQRIAQVLQPHDLVALQELDAGSHRTGYVDLTAYLADQADFPYWHHQLNRNFGRLAQHGNGLLSRIAPQRISEYRLPGMIPGRGALVAEFGHSDESLAVILLHLALGRRARLRQLDYISDLVNRYRHVIVMGDMNCAPCDLEMGLLFRRTRLQAPDQRLCTYPSWQPQRPIDHILVTPELVVESLEVLPHNLSDHLPLSMTLQLPPSLSLRCRRDPARAVATYSARPSAPIV